MIPLYLDAGVVSENEICRRRLKQVIRAGPQCRATVEE